MPIQQQLQHQPGLSTGVRDAPKLDPEFALGLCAGRRQSSSLGPDGLGRGREFGPQAHGHWHGQEPRVGPWRTARRSRARRSGRDSLADPPKPRGLPRRSQKFKDLCLRLRDGKLTRKDHGFFRERSISTPKIRAAFEPPRFSGHVSGVLPPLLHVERD